jgi:hypothetical protein
MGPLSSHLHLLPDVLEEVPFLLGGLVVLFPSSDILKYTK